MYQRSEEAGQGGQQVTPVWPVHLRGAEAIGQTFGVHRRTVVQWRRQGAPIALTGGVYMAEYTMLMQWLVRVSGPGGG